MKQPETVSLTVLAYTLFYFRRPLILNLKQPTVGSFVLFQFYSRCATADELKTAIREVIWSTGLGTSGNVQFFIYHW